MYAAIAQAYTRTIRHDGAHSCAFEIAYSHAGAGDGYANGIADSGANYYRYMSKARI